MPAALGKRPAKPRLPRFRAAWALPWMCCSKEISPELSTLHTAHRNTCQWWTTSKRCGFDRPAQKEGDSPANQVPARVLSD